MNYQFVKAGVLALSVGFLSSCVFTAKDDSATLAFYQQKLRSGVPAGANGLTAFKTSFYPFAQKNCASCHGVQQTPLFVVTSVDSSYAVSKDASFMNFGAVGSSKLAVYSGNGHCGLPGCSGNKEAAVVQLQAWADIENAIAAASAGGTGGGGGAGPIVGGGPVTGGAGASAYLSTAVALPIPLTSGVTYKTMRFPLSNLTPANPLMTGAVFEMEVQLLSATTYRVRNPRILGLRSVVKVTGMHVFVKPSGDAGIGVEDLGAGSVWENDVVNAPLSTLPATLPVGPTVTNPVVPALDTFAMIIGVRSNQDSFTIAFDKLEASTPLVETYASINLNILIPKCLSCHSAANPIAGVSYSTYADTIKANNFNSGNPAASRLYLSTLGGGASMPIGGSKLTAAQSAVLLTWLNAGAPNN